MLATKDIQYQMQKKRLERERPFTPQLSNSDNEVNKIQQQQ